jgi:hypothetical protein
MLTIEEIREKIAKIILEQDTEYTIVKYVPNAIQRIALEYFDGKMPYMYDFGLYDKQDMDMLEESFDEYGETIGFKITADSEEYSRRKSKSKEIDAKKTIANVLKKFPDTLEYYPRAAFVDNGYLFNENFIYCDGIFYMPDSKFASELMDCIEYEKEGEPQFLMAMMSDHGIETSLMSISKVETIDDNYNNDLFEANKKIIDTINNDSSSIIILHGKPGTGKTTYLRHLIYTENEKVFVWVDSSLFKYITDSKFVSFLLNYRNSVFILEDCEALLVSREGEKNSAIQSLLSISDGILGDSLKIKFICTFNTDLDNIDKAILRKGRLKVKYEFKDLCKEKVEKLFEKQNIPVSFAKEMPLCDVYNFNEEEYSNTTKIGF